MEIKISDLYDDALIYIFRYLSLYSPILRLVCKKWNNILCKREKHTNYSDWVTKLIREMDFNIILWLDRYKKLSERHLLKTIKYLVVSDRPDMFEMLVGKLKHIDNKYYNHNKYNNISQDIKNYLLYGICRSNKINMLSRILSSEKFKVNYEYFNILIKSLNNAASTGSIQSMEILYNVLERYDQNFLITSRNSSLYKKCCYTHRYDVYLFLLDKIKSLPELNQKKIVKKLIFFSFYSGFRKGFDHAIEWYNTKGYEFDDKDMLNMTIIACLTNNIEKLKEFENKIRINYNDIIVNIIEHHILCDDIFDYLHFRKRNDNDIKVTPETIKYLVKKGLNINSALSEAIRCQNIHAINIFISMGALLKLETFFNLIGNFLSNETSDHYCVCSYCMNYHTDVYLNTILFLLNLSKKEKIKIVYTKNSIELFGYFDILMVLERYKHDKKYYNILLKLLIKNKIIKLNQIKGLYLYTKLKDYIYNDHPYPDNIFDDNELYHLCNNCNYEGYMDFKHHDENMCAFLNNSDVKSNIENRRLKSKHKQNKKKNNLLYKKYKKYKNNR